MSVLSEKVKLNIPQRLYMQLMLIFENSGFNSVTEYIVFILRELIAGKSGNSVQLTAAEIQQIRKLLQSLGYLQMDKIYGG